MNKITFYKLQSPYPEDITKNCNLTMTEMDENFLNLKNNDISGATYNPLDMTINIIKNDGEEINIDISELNNNIDETVTNHLSAFTKVMSELIVSHQFTYFIGTAKDEHISQTVISKLTKKEGNSSTLFNSITTLKDDFIWFLVPTPIQLNSWTYKGMPIPIMEHVEIIEYDGNLYNAYRNLVPLEANTWDLTIEVSGGVDKYDLNPAIKNVNLEGSLDKNGVLSLTWQTINGKKSTTISGFATTTDIQHVTSLNGNGTCENPLRISNVEQCGYYKVVKDIIPQLPTYNKSNGDRYITVNKHSNFGCLYNKQGMLTIVNLLNQLNSMWRVPTKNDWDVLIDYCETCEDHYKVAGKILKSINYWEGNTNLDKLGFTIFPTGQSNINSELIFEGTKATFWTNTLSDNNDYFLKELTSNTDTVSQSISQTNKYSIRLVADYYGNGLENYTNILGKEYNVVVLKDINQIWIQTNLDYYIDGDTCDRFEYQHSIISLVHTLNHWNGEYWEKKELKQGDNIDVIKNNQIDCYTITNIDNNTNLVKQKTIITDIYGNTVTKIDSGWY